jgi:type IV pilus assembly protein PilM
MVKAVALRQERSLVIAERAGIAAMPDGAVSEGAVLDPAAAATAIGRFCRQQGLGGRRVAVAAAGEDVVILRLKLPRAETESLRAQLPEEIALQLPFPVGQATVDFQVLDDLPQSEWVQALVVAAKREKVERLRETVARAGKTAVVVDATACALSNVFEFNYEPPGSEISALLDLGATTVTVCVVRGATPLLARHLRLACTPLTEQEWSLADRIAAQVERVFEQMDEVAEESPLEPGSGDVARLWLSGGAARLDGLEPVLRSRFRLPIEEIDPFRKIEVADAGPIRRVLEDHRQRLAVAVGLALRGLDGA